VFVYGNKFFKSKSCTHFMRPDPRGKWKTYVIEVKIGCKAVKKLGGDDVLRC
jgi:hypothetical protein